jgi:two-component system phosphate regulon sensor histidine kinase PhoR
VRGSRWQLICTVLEAEQRLVVLEDLSVRVSVARAHADFVANASHELRTPLATILGYVETLGDPKAGEDPATRERFLGIIRHEASRMQALVEDLMSLSRIEALKHDAPDQPVDLVSLAQQCAGEVKGRAAVTFSSNVERASVAGDSGQLAQVLRNLIDNAIKYGKPGGEVAVTIEATDSGRVALTVRDEGDGIAPEHLPRLTERFYRADAGRSRAAGGTGLGLAIVKHIAERHRGRFDISSREGQGTTASLILPLIKAT